jgi:thiol-disulfide isomerase/thioredoxin
MQTMGWREWLVLLVLLAWLAPPAAAQPAEANVTVKPVSYDQMIQTLSNLKGKVVVVDFWADYCIPCKKEFPHLVEMHRKYGKDGLAAVSVSVDDISTKGVEDRVRKFLESQKAAFTNLILNEKPEVWVDKLKIEAVPAVFVFGRDGKIVKKFTDEVNYADIEKLAIELLRK